MTSTRVEITKPVGDVDRAMDAYVQWRNECIAVRNAYGLWAAASATNVAHAFHAYEVALDREEIASERYAALIQPEKGAQHALAA
jgi:hypothetical protein